MRIINKEEIDGLYKKANVSSTGISVSNKLNTGTMTNKLKHEMRAAWEKSESCIGFKNRYK